MILNRTTKETTIFALYESSNILASYYEMDNKILTIIFKNGGSYSYIGVNNNDYVRFETAESQGNVFNEYIKKYDFQKNEKVNTEQFINEVTELKNNEIREFEKVLISKMLEVTKIYETTGKVDKDITNDILKISEIIKTL